MSRTLRRPMFRGGRVSAYGTGIAAPLVPGYKGGGQIGGGIIAGLPHADGRYGFQNPELFNVDDLVAKTQTGGELIEENVPASTWENVVELEKFGGVPKYDEDFLGGKFDSFVKGVERRVELGEDEAFQTDVDLGMQLQPPVDPEDAAFWKIYKEDPEQAYKYWKENISTWGTKQKEQMEHAADIGADIDYGITASETEIPELTADQIEINRLNKIIADKTEEPTEVDAKAMVAENKALFADLLGLDKARGEDITSMLLGFAGSKGDTTMEKFQDFAAKEAVRPGRRQKLEDAAGTLAIQDYVAGKRSKEQISQLKAIEDYKAKLKLETVMPQETDTIEEVAFKLNSAGLNYSSAKGLKMIIGIKDKTPMGDNVVTIDGIKIEDLEKGRSDKILKKLKTGYNIIDDDGVKRIIKYDGSGTVGGVDVYTISEFWNLKS